MDFFAEWNASDTLQLIAFLGAALGFVLGLLRYQESQSWKRREFVAGEVEKLLNNSQARNALVMLDYTHRTISLFPNRSPEYRQWARLDREFVAAMLIPHEVDHKEVVERPRFGQEGAAIRDCFDELLTRLTNLQSMVVAELIEDSDLEPYLAYWVEKLAGSPNDDPTDKRFRRNLRLYIDQYGFKRVVKLCETMGHNISRMQGDEAELRADCADQSYLQLVEDKRQLMKNAARDFKLRYGAPREA